MWYHMNVNSCREAKTHRSLELASYKCSQIQTPESQSDTVSKINVEIIKKKTYEVVLWYQKKGSYMFIHSNIQKQKHRQIYIHREVGMHTYNIHATIHKFMYITYTHAHIMNGHIYLFEFSLTVITI